MNFVDMTGHREDKEMIEKQHKARGAGQAVVAVGGACRYGYGWGFQRRYSSVPSIIGRRGVGDR